MKKKKKLTIDELHLIDLKRTAMYFQAEKTAYELKLLCEWCCPITDELNTIFENSFNIPKFSEKEKEVILADAIELLRIKHHINILNDKPILVMDKISLSSHITNQ